MKIVGFVQGRIGSTRLPRKVMLEILGKPMIWHVWNRMATAKRLDQAVILTSNQSGNEVISRFAEREGIPCFAGSETDLLERYSKAADQFNADVIVRVTADCPVVDPDIIDELVLEYQASKEPLDYLSNSRPKASYPHGLDVEVFTREALARADREVSDPFRREWLTTNFFEHPEKYRQKNIQAPLDFSSIRLTVDYQKDFDAIKKIFETLTPVKRIFKWTDILELLEKNQELKQACLQPERHESYQEEVRKHGGNAQ